MTADLASPLARWSWARPSLENTGDWSRVDVDLPLDRSITLVATAAAALPQSPHGVRDSVWMRYHERVLDWRLEDTLDDMTWFRVGEGTLTRTGSSGVVRVSSPLGTRLRLAWWAVCVVAAVRSDDGSTQSREYCNGADCGFDHSTLQVTNAAFHVAVRSI